MARSPSSRPKPSTSGSLARSGLRRLAPGYAPYPCRGAWRAWRYPCWRCGAAGARCLLSLGVSCWLRLAVISSCIATVRRRCRVLRPYPLYPPMARSFAIETSGGWPLPGFGSVGSNSPPRRIWRCSSTRAGGCHSPMPPVCWRRCIGAETARREWRLPFAPRLMPLAPRTARPG